MGKKRKKERKRRMWKSIDVCVWLGKKGLHSYLVAIHFARELWVQKGYIHTLKYFFFQIK